MINNNEHKKSDNFPLQPYQNDLIELFFQKPATRGFVVEWDTGLGRNITAAHIMRRFLAIQATARIIFLTENSSLRDQMQGLCRNLQLESKVVDRFHYREMQDATLSNHALWPEGKIYLLTKEFAKQEDIRSSLKTIPWSLLVIDEAHRLQKQKEDFAYLLLSASPALRILFLTTKWTHITSDLGFEPFISRHHHWRESNDFSPRVEESRIFFEFTRYDLDNSEQRLKHQARKIQSLLRAWAPNLGSKQDDEFQLSLGSSPLAFEESLRRLRNRLTHESPNHRPDEDDETRSPKNAESNGFSITDGSALRSAIYECLIELDAVSVDSKLDSLIDIFAESAADGNLRQSTCIYVKYKATLLYIETALQDMGIVTYSNSSSSRDIFETLKIFNEKGGVFLFILDTMQGLEIPEVANLIIYDLPSTEAKTLVLSRRFNGLNRTKQLKIRVLLERGDDNESIKIENSLKEIFNDSPMPVKRK